LRTAQAVYTAMLRNIQAGRDIFSHTPALQATSAGCRPR
jgi:hypothetical protein